MTKAELLQKLAGSIVKITNESSLSRSAYAGLLEVIEVVHRLVENNDSLRSEIEILKNKPVRSTSTHVGW